MDVSRREMLKRGMQGLAAVGAVGLTLRADALPTPASGADDAHADDIAHGAGVLPILPPTIPTVWTPTEDNIVGPYYRAAAPYRAKITPALEPGMTLVVRGRVWGFDTKKPLAGAVLDIWQANAAGRYDNDDPSRPPAVGVFVNRARLLTDETGYYEYETVHPGRYKTDPDHWRPSHVHYMVRHSGYTRLITQLYFKGDPYNDTDPYIKPSLIIEVAKRQIHGQNCELGVFDVVLAR